MAQYPKSFKNCATCSYWGGDRKSESLGSYAIIASDKIMGKCLYTGSGASWRGSEKQPTASCNKWQAWAALR